MTEKASPFRALIIAGGISLAVVVGIVSLLVYLDEQERAQRQLVQHTYKVIDALQDLEATTSEAEIATRAFLPQVEESRLEPFRTATSELGAEFKVLNDLVADNPQRIGEAATLEKMVDDEFTALDAIIEAAENQEHEKALSIAAENKGASLSEEIQKSVTRMETEERNLLEQRESALSRTRLQIQIAAVALLLLAITWAVGALRMSIARERQRRATAAKLLESEALYRLLANNSTDIIANRDFLNGQMTYFSPAVREVLGRDPGELIGERWLQLLHPEDLEAADLERRAVSRENPTLTSQFRISHKDGHYIWMEAHGRYIPGDDLRPALVQSAWRDVSDRKAAEEEAIKMRMEADKANKAKSEFLAMMSHELRTPMAGVLGIADLLLLGDVDAAEQMRLTKQLKRSALSLLDILNDILDFSKIEAGKLEIDHQPFSLGDVLADLRGLFGPAASAKGLIFEVVTAEGLPDGVEGDGKRLRQIVVNLVNNAIKFTSRGRITLRIDFKPVDEHSVELHGYVKDTGIGISKENIAKLFQPFVQADSSTSRTFGGTGLGLTIARLLTSAMKGCIWVESELGYGTTFFFTIPLNVVRNTFSQATRTERRSLASRQLRPLSILFAEDTDTVRQIVVAMLERMGHKVEAVEDGAAAVARAQTNSYDVILMDMQMPIMDGLDATKTIRAFEGNSKRTPIIALTADAIYDHREKYLSGGVDAIVTKPVNWEHLVAKLAQLVPDVAVPAAVDRRKKEEPQNVPLLNDLLIAELNNALGDGVLAGLFKSFGANVGKHRDDIVVALDSSDLGTAKKCAHALKGLSSQLGADQVAAVARLIEVDTSSLEEARQHLPALKTVLEKTLAEIATRYKWTASS